MDKFFSRWFAFSQERFPLFRHIILIIFYFSANALVALRSSGLSPHLSIKGILPAFIVLCIFLHLRIFDEIKDYKHDLIVHKNRPLARGLIRVSEAKAMAFGLIILELVLSLFINSAAFVAAGCTLIYSLIMYKEFFIGDWLRPKMATYALAHTLVSCWLSLFVYSAVTGQSFWTITPVYSMFVLVSWMIFNVFEFGRKTFGKEEEQELVESYSKRLGPARAASNVVVMAVIAVLIALRLGRYFSLGMVYFVSMALLLAIIIISSIHYGYSNSRSSATFFRGACSAFILLYNVIITAGIFIQGA